MLKIQELFNLLGKTLVVEEKMMGAGTVIAGCGTAFGLRFIRAIMTGAVEIGFTAQQAKEMALQIVLGSCSLLEDSGVHPEEEIDKVTTPGGITITAINEMENNGFSSSVIKGIIKAHNKDKKK